MYINDIKLANFVVAEPGESYQSAKSANRWVEVLVDFPGNSGLFTYKLPAHLEIKPGDILSVPFGAQQLGAIAIRLLTELNVDLPPEKIKEVEESDLTPGAQYILECLKDWRTDKANELKVPKYMVCHNSELINIAFHQPTTMEALKNIKGFGEKKAQRFGEDIIALLNAV